MDFMKPEPDPDGESFLTYQDENKLIDIEEKDAIIMKFPVKNSEYEHKIDTIKLECEANMLPHMMATPNEGDVTDKKHDDLTVSSAFPFIKCETKFIMDFVKSEPISNSETNVASSYSDTEVTETKEEEDPLLITVPVMQDENEEHHSTDVVSGESVPDGNTQHDDGCHFSTRDENSSKITPVTTTPLLPRPPKRSSQVSSQQADLTNKVLLSANEHFTRPKVQEDRFDIFGKNVAMKLRDLPTQQRLLAERIINEALFEAEMGTLTTSHKLIVPPQHLFRTMHYQHQAHPHPSPQVPTSVQHHEYPPCPQLAGVHSDTVASISSDSPSAASYLSNLSADDL